ncbi:uncharacterized protein I303_106075 [Kwoniella dejecticola CBS 10117]|uniref:Uncharacterized protein n=1 Tax=Kwoniella dejecticola CBS 10117 TaxID=1296121 RepID=A0A1A6A186_9TREE|nr:uncharacterized protein I303_06095 [Kwoniella dejecticola CBS 10117]OBR83812.1 hypothetical protein I303_06095 [Kwoniella dejecticola CBS 10117]
MVKLFHGLFVLTSATLLSFSLPTAPDDMVDFDAKHKVVDDQPDYVANIQLIIPKYSEWVDGTDQSQYERGEHAMQYHFTQKQVDENVKFSFVWTTYERKDVPKTFFTTPYWNMTCNVAAGQAFDGTASFTLDTKEPWIHIDEAKAWAGVSCNVPECLAEACKDEKTPRIDTVRYRSSRIGL